jgi:RND family efflux transporter MFP subunit
MDGSQTQPVLKILSRVLRAGVGLLALVIAGAIFAYLTMTAPEPERAPLEERALVARSIRLEPTPIARVWDGYGTARSMNGVDVKAEITGVVISRPDDIEAGRAVTRGQTIIRIDPEDFELRLEAETQLAASLQAEIDALDAREKRLKERYELATDEANLARNEYDRAVEARDAGAGNLNEIETKLAAVRRAEGAAAIIAQTLDTIPAERAGLSARLAQQRAVIRLAERELERTTITAPIDGLLQLIDAEETELVSPGQLVARVVDLARIEIPIRVPVSAGHSIVIGDQVDLRADSALEAEWHGQVVGIAPEADSESRSMTVFIEVRQDLTDALRERRAVSTEGGRLLLPGQFVVARVTTSVRDERFLVPRIAVERDRVMIVGEDGIHAHRAPVRVLFHIDASRPDLDPAETQWAVIEMTDALPPGTQVIVSNLDQITDGTPVRTTETLARDGLDTGREGGS